VHRPPRGRSFDLSPPRTASCLPRLCGTPHRAIFVSHPDASGRMIVGQFGIFHGCEVSASSPSFISPTNCRYHRPPCTSQDPRTRVSQTRRPRFVFASVDPGGGRVQMVSGGVPARVDLRKCVSESRARLCADLGAAEAPLDPS
jgi:hypothetical protein